MVFLCIESVKMEKRVCFIEASMRGLTALLEMDWFTLVCSADVPWNLRGHISTYHHISAFFSSSQCCSNSLPNGSFPYVVTFLIPASVYGDDAQPWHTAQNWDMFSWEGCCHQPQLQMRALKKRQANCLKQIWLYNLLCQTPVCFSVHLSLLPYQKWESY